MRMRLLISSAIGISSGFYCWFMLAHFHLGAADFHWAIALAQSLLEHKNPYSVPWQLYPLPAALFGLPFVAIRPEIAGGVFYGISSALLAFCITRYGYQRLIIFLAYPFWAGILVAQWTPLIMASAFIPYLWPSILVKPQLGLPIAVAYRNRRGILICILVGLVSLIIMPHWPAYWIRTFGSYRHFFPLLILPGPLLLLAFIRYRDRDAIFLMLAAVMPQRWFYDAFILWLIPKTKREIAYTVFLSWGMGILRWYTMNYTLTQIGRWMVIFAYLPMLAVVLMRTPKSCSEP